MDAPMTTLAEARARSEAARERFYLVAAKPVRADTGIEAAAAEWTAAIHDVRRLIRSGARA